MFGSRENQFNEMVEIVAERGNSLRKNLNWTFLVFYNKIVWVFLKIKLSQVVWKKEENEEV